MRKSLGIVLATLALTGIAAIQTASADVVVVVSAKSTETTMTAEQITQIYLGKSTKMKPLDSGDGPVRSQFYSKVAGKDEAQVRAIWSKLVFTGKAKPPTALPSSADVVKAVAADANALGYIDRAALDPSVKVVYEIK
jgi:ABC-type phosphate transport system substrate-binding protein